MPISYGNCNFETGWLRPAGGPGVGMYCERLLPGDASANPHKTTHAAPCRERHAYPMYWRDLNISRPNDGCPACAALRLRHREDCHLETNVTPCIGIQQGSCFPDDAGTPASPKGCQMRRQIGFTKMPAYAGIRRGLRNARTRLTYVCKRYEANRGNLTKARMPSNRLNLMKIS